MVKLRVDSVGDVGLVRDEAWPTIQNAKCQNSSVYSWQTFIAMTVASNTISLSQ